VSWGAATDNVGVTGFQVYLSGNQVVTTSSLTYAYTGSSCGRFYLLAVRALDAAGNVSDQRFVFTTIC